MMSLPTRTRSASGALSPVRSIHAIAEDDSVSVLSGASERSTLSAFLGRRRSGEVPLLGGDIRTGIREFGSATVGSLAALPEDLGIIASYLNKLAVGVAKSTNNTAVLIINPEMENENLKDLVRLDEQKLLNLLNLSAIDKSEVVHYLNLIKGLDNQLIKAARAKEERAAKRTLYATFGTTVAEASALGVDSCDISDLLNAIHYELHDPANKVHFVAAITHESYCDSLETNRVLAYMGDKLAGYYLGVKAYEARVPVATVSNVFQRTMSNDAWNKLGMSISLGSIIRIGSGTHAVTPKMVASAFEAVLAAVYIDGGEEALMKLNDVVPWLDTEDFSTKYMTVFDSPPASLN